MCPVSKSEHHRHTDMKSVEASECRSDRSSFEQEKLNAKLYDSIPGVRFVQADSLPLLTMTRTE
jgi:hypothetical protein